MKSIEVLFFAIFFQLIVCSIAFSGEWLSLSEKVFRADAIIEVRLVFDKPIPKKWKNKKYDPLGWGFPDQLIGRAKTGATITRILKHVGGDSISLPGSFHVFSSNSACWWKAHRRGEIRALIFLTKEKNGYKMFLGVEHETGMYSDLNSDFELLIKAIEETSQWGEERMRAVPVDMLWQRQKSILRNSESSYLLQVAKYFLETHDAADAVDECWGKIGTGERKKNEKRAMILSTSHCKN